MPDKSPISLVAAFIFLLLSHTSHAEPLDSTAPVSIITTPAPYSAIKGTTCTINGTASDGAGSGVATVEVSTDGGATWSLASGTGNWTYDWTLPPDGTYIIKSRAADNAGNVEQPAADLTGAIYTIAGNGSGGYSGDGGPARQAALNWPVGVASDSAGNVYIADMYNNVVRKVDTTGIITTVAGKGVMGYSGDGGPAAQAMLHYPTGITVDAYGNLLITDSYNARVRKVDTNGIITTVAGNGVNGYSGDGGPAIQAALSWPEGVTADPVGNLYIACYGEKRIRKVDINGVITTFAGNGSEGSTGNGGPATQASFYGPMDVALDKEGDLYIADYGIVRKVDTGGIIMNGTALLQVYYPGGVAVDGQDNLYVADRGYRRVWKVDASGVLKAAAGTGEPGYTGDGGPATQAGIYDPERVTVDARGNLFITESNMHSVRKVAGPGPSVSFMVDNTMPTILWGARIPAPNTHGWNNNSVYVYFTTADDGSGLSSPVASSPLTFKDEGRALYKVVTVADKAGNAVGYTSPAVNIDRTNPMLTVKRASVSFKNRRFFATISGKASDTLSGIDKVRCTLKDDTGKTVLEGDAQLESRDRYSFMAEIPADRPFYYATVTATDNADNESVMYVLVPNRFVRPKRGSTSPLPAYH